MIDGYKSSIQRLTKLFKQSRDMWKERALEKQKKLRAQAIRIRDLETSRALWKHRAETAEAALRRERRAVSPPRG
jgi:hypothetical protein